jgi:hypothetical protein
VEFAYYVYTETSVNKDTTGTTVECPVYGGVFILDYSTVHMSMWGILDGTEQWFPVLTLKRL